MASVSTVDVLKKLKDLGEATAKQLGVPRAYINGLAAEGLVVEAGVHLTGQRGRPAVTFKLSKKGSDKVRRAK